MLGDIFGVYGLGYSERDFVVFLFFIGGNLVGGIRIFISLEKGFVRI